MAGPNSWGGAKKRLKRPLTAEAKRSADQDTGKILRGARKIDYANTPLRKGPRVKLTGEVKKLKALNKKLREIEALAELQAKGEELDEQQMEKLECMGAVLEQMAELGVPLGA